MAFPADWSRKVAISLDNTKCGSGDSSNFTVLLTRSNLPDEMCSPSDGNRAQSDGGDIRFSSDSAGTTQLALHVERWEYDTTDAAGDADIALNVIVPTLNGTGTGSDSVIYAWYNTAGTDTQPAATDTYGAQNAYDANHCHVWTFDESPSDTPPEYKDVFGRDLTETGTGASSPAGKNGGNSFDGDLSTMALGAYAGFYSPDNSSAAPCTNTGLCYIPGDDSIAVINWDDGEIIEVNKTTGAEIATVTLSQGETGVQGLAYDSVNDEYLVNLAGAGGLTIYDRSTGTYARTMGTNVTPNAVAYDFTDDAIWISNSAGSVRQLNKSTGAIISTVSLTGDAAGVAIEGITHNATDNTLYITTDTGNMVYEVNKSTGATLQSFRGPIDIEHCAYDHTDDQFYICGDAGFHSAGSFGENVIYRWTPDGQPVDWRAPSGEYTLEAWVYPDNVGATQSIMANFSAAAVNGGRLQEWQIRSSGVWRTYSPDTTSVNSASSTLTASTWHHLWQTYSLSGTEMFGYVNNSLAINDTGGNGTMSSDGRISWGGRPQGATYMNGRIDSARLHKVVRDASWRTARYNNTNAPSTFATAGTPQANGGGPVIPIFAHHYRTMAA